MIYAEFFFAASQPAVRDQTHPAWTLPLSKLSKGNSGFWTRDAPGLCFDWGDAGEPPARGVSTYGV